MCLHCLFMLARARGFRGLRALEGSVRLSSGVMACLHPPKWFGFITPDLGAQGAGKAVTRVGRPRRPIMGELELGCRRQGEA